MAVLRLRLRRDGRSALCQDKPVPGSESVTYCCPVELWVTLSPRTPQLNPMPCRERFIRKIPKFLRFRYAIFMYAY